MLLVRQFLIALKAAQFDLHFVLIQRCGGARTGWTSAACDGHAAPHGGVAGRGASHRAHCVPALSLVRRAPRDRTQGPTRTTPIARPGVQRVRRAGCGRLNSMGVPAESKKGERRTVEPTRRANTRSTPRAPAWKASQSAARGVRRSASRETPRYGLLSSVSRQPNRNMRPPASQAASWGCQVRERTALPLNAQ